MNVKRTRAPRGKRQPVLRAGWTTETNRTQSLAIYLTLAALVWVIFGRTLRHNFVNYDDQNYVYQNPAITGGLKWQALRYAFTHIHAQNWHPLTTLSHMLDCQLFGLAPAGHHFTNVLLHSGAVLLLFAALRSLTGAAWRSAVVAAIFAVHPLRVESVAWIAERKDVLSGVFFMLTLLSYASYVREPSLRRYALVFVAYACGLLSKPMLVTMPFVLLLLDYWPLQRFIGKHVPGSRIVWLEKIPLLLLAIGSVIATLLAQHEYIGVGEDLPLSARLTNAATSYVIYIGQMFWPTGLIPFYPHRETRIPVSEIAASIALLLAVSGVVIASRKSRPYLAVGWFWYLGMLVPVIGIVQVGWQAHADRYTYLPQIGLCIGIVWLTSELATRLNLSRIILGSAAVSVVSALSAAAFVQTGYWRDSETLWRRTLAITPDNDVAQNNLGTQLLEAGKNDRAAELFTAALHLRPGNVPARVNLARIMLARGDTAAAAAELRHVLDLESYTEAASLLGQLLVQQGDLSGALASWNAALATDPNNANLCNNIAWVLSTSPDPAVRNGDRAVELAKKANNISGGNNAIGVRTLAAALAENGRFDDAIATAQHAVDLAKRNDNAQLAAEIEQTIALYRQHIPLRDPSLVQTAEQ